MEAALEFSCVPHQVVQDLQDIGNWKARASAVESLHKAILEVPDKMVLLPTLSKLLRFMMTLVADPNFKISISTMQILQDLLKRLGTDAQPYLGTILETLMQKLGDRNEMVRQAATAVMATFMNILGPQPVINALGGALVHPEWRVREQGLNVMLLGLLTHAKDKFDYPTVVRAYSEALKDNSVRVRTVSLEGLTVLHVRLGTLLQGLLTTVGASDSVKHAVAERINQQLPLPYVNVEGHLEHQAHARPASAAKPKPNPAVVAVAPGASVLAYKPLTSVTNTPNGSSAVSMPVIPAQLLANEQSQPQTCDTNLSVSLEGPVLKHFQHDACNRNSTSEWAMGLPGVTISTPHTGFATLPTHPTPATNSTISSPVQPQYSPFQQSSAAGRGGMVTADRYPSWSSISSSTGNIMLPESPGADSVEAVEHSGGSLLQWVRPSRHTPPSSSKQGMSRSKGAKSFTSGSSPMQRAASEGWSNSNSTCTPTSRSFSAASNPEVHHAAMACRSGSSTSPTNYTRGSFDAATYTSAKSASEWGQLQVGIQHRRPTVAIGNASNMAVKIFPGVLDLAESEASPASSESLKAADQEVDGRSESLLLWRLPARPATNIRKAPSQDSPQARSDEPAASLGPHSEGSRGQREEGSIRPSILQKLDGFKQKLFGPDSSTHAQHELPSVPWSIPAVRNDNLYTSDTHQEDSHGDETASCKSDSPSKGERRLSLLKKLKQEATERRRVWSAPISSGPPSMRATMVDSEDSLGQPGAFEGTGAGQSVSVASPVRPGLAALKVRARTARVGPPGANLQPLDSPQYGYDVLTDVFGPDRATLTTAWSAPQPGPSPTRASLFSRAGSPSWRQPPNSPATFGGSPGGQRRASVAFMQKIGASPGAGDAASLNPMAADLTPVDDPDATMRQLLQALERANMSQKKELDWQSQYEALISARRIIHNHASSLLPYIHPFVVAAAPVIDSLRSIPARLAITVFQELIEAVGPAIDSELEHLVPLLVKKAGVTSVAGRDNFLAAEADKALGILTATASDARVVTALLNCLTNCKAPDTKAKVSMHLDSCIQQHGHRIVCNGPLAARLLRAAVGFLDEGSLDSRTSGKRLLWEMRRLMDVHVGPDEFRKALGRLEMKTEKVWDVFQQGRPPLPARALASGRINSPSASPSTPSFHSGSPGGTRGMSVLSAGPLMPGSPASPHRHSAAKCHLSSSVSHVPSPTPATKPGTPGQRSVAFKTLTFFGDGPPTSSSPGGSPTKVAAPSAIRRSLRPASGRLAAGPGPSAAAELSPALQQRLDSLQNSLSSKSEWRERIQGLALLRDISAELADLPGDVVLRLCDDLALAVVHNNLKVQLEALQTLEAVLAAAGGEGLAPCMNSLVPALARALDSGALAARNLAISSLDTMVSTMDATLFIQPYMQAVAHSGNVRSKTVLLDRLKGMVVGLYAARAQLVTRHVLPPLFAALEDKRLDVKGAVHAVLGVLAGCMGEELLDACVSLAPGHSLLVSGLVAQHQHVRY